MIIRGRPVLLLREQSFQSRSLRGCGLQHQHHAIHREVGRRRSLIVLRARERMGVAPQDDELAFINRLGDQRGRANGLSGAALGNKNNRKDGEQAAE